MLTCCRKMQLVNFVPASVLPGTASYACAPARQDCRIHGKRTMSVCCLRRIEQSGYGNCHGFLAQGQLNSSPNIHIGMVRVMEVYGDNRKEAEKNVRRSDKARRAYYKHISGRTWGKKENYELVIDSSCGVEKGVDTIVEHLAKIRE